MSNQTPNPDATTKPPQIYLNIQLCTMRVALGNGRYEDVIFKIRSHPLPTMTYIAEGAFRGVQLHIDVSHARRLEQCLRDAIEEVQERLQKDNVAREAARIAHKVREAVR